MSLLENPITRLDGTPSTLAELSDGKVALIVNVASQCDSTPQYSALDALHKQYAEREL